MLERPKTNPPADRAPPRPPAWIIGLILVIVCIAARLPFLAEPGFRFDQSRFVFWAHLSGARGLAAVYDIEIVKRYDRHPCILPPLHILSFRGLGHLYHAWTGSPVALKCVTDVYRGEATPAARAANIVFKLPGLLADAATVALIFWYLTGRGNRRLAIGVALVYALHPAVIHDSAMWGQIDAVHTMLMVASLIAALRGAPILMTLLACIAILFKLQAVVLAPVWLAVWWCESIRADRTARQCIRRAAIAAGLSIALVILACLPFLASPLPGPLSPYLTAVGYYPLAHVNGFSMWFLTNPMDQPRLARLSTDYRRDDVALLGPHVTAKRIGLAGVALCALFCLWRMLRRRCDAESIQWAACVLTLAFFVLPTQIHERYLFPAIAIWALSARPCARWWITWGIVGLTAGLNAWWVWPGSAALYESVARQPIGAWCAIALMALLGMLLIRGPQPGFLRPNGTTGVLSPTGAVP